MTKITSEILRLASSSDAPDDPTWLKKADRLVRFFVDHSRVAPRCRSGDLLVAAATDHFDLTRDVNRSID